MDSKKLTLYEIEEKNKNLFQQFLFLIWQPNPKLNNVKIKLDNGEISFTLKNDAFISLINDTLLSNNPSIEIYNNTKKIELSLKEYGSTWFYDRTKNILKRLTRVDDIDILNMKDIYNIEKQKYEKNNNSHISVIKEMEDKIISKDMKLNEKNNKLKNYLYNSLKTFSNR